MTAPSSPSPHMQLQHYDVIILGAGGAGMMCAIHAGKRGKTVLLLDHSKKLGGKILISGGGRCNFTNLGASPNQYVSQNPHFCKSALSRYTPSDFIALVEAHGIAYHEKKLGQQFCDQSASQIVDLLKDECDAVGAKIILDTKIGEITYVDEPKETPLVRFHVQTFNGNFTCSSLVVATGGLSIPKIGATGFGYQIGKQFGHTVVETAPALDGFTLETRDAQKFGELSGISADVILTCHSAQGKPISFRENILFTHAGLSGPATLQGSLHWRKGEPIYIDFFPQLTEKGETLFQWLVARKKEGSKSLIKNLLTDFIRSRLAEILCDEAAKEFPTFNSPLQQVSEKDLEVFCKRLHAYSIIPSGTVGYSKAEVTRGGINTDELSSKTMESKLVPGLYFIGEVVDVTGWLGGYNFQWAWASGAAAGNAVE